MCDYQQYSQQHPSFKLFHMQPTNDYPPQQGGYNNNNYILPPSCGNLASLPHYAYNYQDFPPSIFDMNCTDNTKAWKKRQTKRKLPEKVLRERQLRRNERERARQNRLNDAFDVLRNTIPDFLTPCKKGQKLTQIETLRLAKHYIAGLRDLLDNDDKVKMEE